MTIARVRFDAPDATLKDKSGILCGFVHEPEREGQLGGGGHRPSATLGVVMVDGRFRTFYLKDLIFESWADD